MKTLVYICLFSSLSSAALGLGSNQLYTGDPWTIPPGKTQLLGYTDATYPSRARLGGMAIRPGITSNTDAKIAYSYLWNSNGPNAQFGPNVAFKWRFAGNGLSNPSLAISAQYAIDQRTGGHSHKGDFGFTAIGLYPTRYAKVLANLGHVFVGDNVPDLRFISCAIVRPVAKCTLFAIEYSTVKRLGVGGSPTSGRQVAAAVIYGDRMGCAYSAEVGYLIDSERVKWHTTLGISTVF